VADDEQAKAPAATPGRVVHYHAALPELEEGSEAVEREAPAPAPAIVVGDAPEGGVDLYVLPSRYSEGGVVQAVRHDDDEAEEDDPDDEAQPRTHAGGTWGWPPRA
jgi:hypothetical protein